MKRLLFKLKLYEQQEQKFVESYNAMWPELKELFEDIGIREYSIFLDAKSLTIYETMKVNDAAIFDLLSKHQTTIMWYLILGDLVETDKNNIPIRICLNEIYTQT